MILLLLSWISGWATSGNPSTSAFRGYLNFADGISRPIYDLIGPQALCIGDSISYITWHGRDLDPFGITFNHINSHWGDTIRIGNNPLSNDNHGAPSICQDTLGYFHVFYGCHNTQVQYAKSTNPNDFNLWTDKGNLGSLTSTYPHATVTANNIIYVIYRRGDATNGCAGYIKSIDGGASYGAFQEIVKFDSPAYSTGYGNIEYEYGSPEKIHYGWCRATSGSDRFNIYHAYLNVSDNNMYSMADSNLGTKISNAEGDSFCLVFNSGLNKTYAPRIRILNNIPHILFPVGDSVKYTKWNGSSWDSPINVITHTEGYFDFIVNDTNDIDAFVISAGRDTLRGGNLELYEWNGITWNNTRTILREGRGCDALWIPQIILNFNPEIKIIFSEYIDQYSHWTTLIRVFAWGDSGLVGRY